MGKVAGRELRRKRIEGTSVHWGDGDVIRTSIDAKHSLIEVDILLVPVLPAPQSYVDEELRDGAQDFVNGLRDKAQGTVGPVVSL